MLFSFSLQLKNIREHIIDPMFLKVLKLDLAFIIIFENTD